MAHHGRLFFDFLAPPPCKGQHWDESELKKMQDAVEAAMQWTRSLVLGARITCALCAGIALCFQDSLLGQTVTTPGEGCPRIPPILSGQAASVELTSARLTST